MTPRLAPAEEEDAFAQCDDCCAYVPVEELSLVCFADGEGYACEACLAARH